MLLKKGVRIGGVQAEIVLALMVVEREFNALKTDPYQELVVTSCTDGVHKVGSLHYEGLAVDLRSRDLTSAQRQAFLMRLREALGPEFDVILEKDHFHLEFDPS